MNAEQRLLSLDKEQKGKLGESICRFVLSRAGYYCIPLCTIGNGGPPAVGSGRERRVLPDFDIASANGAKAFLDVKVKTQSILWRTDNEVRHGINRRHYEHYRSMGEIFDKQSGLFIVELLNETRQWSGTILLGSFAYLGLPIYGVNERPSKVYWPRRLFISLGSFQAEELRQMANGAYSGDLDIAEKVHAEFCYN